MRSIASGIAVLLMLAGCHWNKPAQDAESSDDTASSSEPSSEPSTEPSSKMSTESAPTGGPSALDNPELGKPSTKADKATIRDDTEKKDLGCGGMTISDLVASLSQASCEVPASAAALKQPQAAKDALEVKVSSESKIVPGSTAQISVVFRNKGKTKLPLDFTVDPDPRFTFELYTPKGARADKPPGNEPPLPAQVSDNAPAEAHTARVTLFPNGTATAILPWQAVKYKWAAKERAKGALAGRGYPREPSGPLPKGKYVLRVVTPLTNVDEGVDHEMSQPRVNIEIAGTPEPATPPPGATPKKEPGGPAAAASSEASVEARFLKVTGATPPAAAPPPKKKR
jgi:hypothetical protein